MSDDEPERYCTLCGYGKAVAKSTTADGIHTMYLCRDCEWKMRSFSVRLTRVTKEHKCILSKKHK